MQVRPDNKYALNDLHQEIDLYDRKIAHCQNVERFDSELARASALHRLVTKRATLAKAARAMAERGVETDAKYLPRSFKAMQATAKATS